MKEFAAAVRRVGEGGSAIDPTIVSQLLGRRREDNPVATLTPREREVLELMAEGRSNQGIADRLVITERAVAEAHHEHLRASSASARAAGTITAACSPCSPSCAPSDCAFDGEGAPDECV